MDRAFRDLLMEKLAFPPEARESLNRDAQLLEEKGLAGELEAALVLDEQRLFAFGPVNEKVEDIAKRAGLSPDALWMLLLIHEAQDALIHWLAGGKEEALFWATWEDLRYKVIECKINHDVWGTFVAFWYDIFFAERIVKLGRLEYETIRFSREDPFVYGGLTVKKGDIVRNIHIPSSGEPFDEKSRLASYRMAYDHFREELHGGPLICVCHSWLIYPGYAPLLGPDSNILGFQRDFCRLEAEEEESFYDAWRLFGSASQGPVESWPEDSSLRRGFKQHFLSGRKAGAGRGILLFDGEKLLH